MKAKDIFGRLNELYLKGEGDKINDILPSSTIKDFYNKLIKYFPYKENPKSVFNCKVSYMIRGLTYIPITSYTSTNEVVIFNATYKLEVIDIYKAYERSLSKNTRKYYQDIIKNIYENTDVLNCEVLLNILKNEMKINENKYIYFCIDDISLETFKFQSFDSMKDEIDNKFNYSFLRIHSDKNVLLDRLESGFYYENMNTEE